MSSASELFYSRRSRASRSADRGLVNDGVSSDRDRHSLRRSFLRRRRNHLAGGEDMVISRHPRTLLRSEHEQPLSIDSNLGESSTSSSINNGSTSADRMDRLSVPNNGQLPTPVLQARARLLERLRGFSVQQNRQEEGASGLAWNDHHEEEEGRNLHDTRRTRRISLTGARREMGSSSTIILEQLATVATLIDRIRSHLTNTGDDLPQYCFDRSPGLNREAINNLLHEVFEETEDSDDAGALFDCSVCLESFKEGEVLLRLHCGHRFHCACLEPWLRTCADCPYCRART